MAWVENRESAIRWRDVTKGSTIGGFTRDPEGQGGTGVGPVSSPDGSRWFIIVDDIGTVKTIAET